MLSSHSRLSIPPETRFLLPVFRRVGSFRDLRQTPNRLRLARAVVRPRGTKFGHLRLDPERVKKEIVAGRPTVGAALSAPFRLYADERGKARWGDKRPTYFRNIDLIRALFPDAQVVHLVRDPRDCVASLRRMRWWRQGSIGALATWAHAVDCARRAERRLPAGSYLELRYEDLVAEPRRELERLGRFLGEDFEEAMLAPRSEAERLPARQREDWHGETRAAVGPQRVGRYAKELAPDEVALVEAVAGSRMRRLGYAVPDRAWVSPKAPLRFAGTLASMRLRTRVLAARDSALVRRHGPVSYR